MVIFTVYSSALVLSLAYSLIKYMQEKGKDHEQFGICHRLFNFIMNSLIGRGLKRLTNQGPLDEYARQAKLKDDDDSDPIVKIHFKQTEELDYRPHVDKLGSSAKDDKGMKKEILLRNGTVKPQVQGKVEARSQGEGSTGPSEIIIPITNKEGQNEKKEKANNNIPTAISTTPVQSDASKPMLTGLGLNINEVSEIFIKNTKERMTKTSGNGA